MLDQDTRRGHKRGIFKRKVRWNKVHELDKKYYGSSITKLNLKSSGKNRPEPVEVVEDGFTSNLTYSMDKKKRWELIDSLQKLQLKQEQGKIPLVEKRIIVYEEQSHSSLHKVHFSKIWPQLNTWLRPYYNKNRGKRVQKRRKIRYERKPGKKDVHPGVTDPIKSTKTSDHTDIVYIVLKAPDVSKYPHFCIDRSQRKAKYIRKKRQRMKNKMKLEYLQKFLDPDDTFEEDYDDVEIREDGYYPNSFYRRHRHDFYHYIPYVSGSNVSLNAHCLPFTKYDVITKKPIISRPLYQNEFNRLPKDILWYIFSYTDSKSLAYFSSTSKWWFQITFQVYTSFSLNRPCSPESLCPFLIQHSTLTTLDLSAIPDVSNLIFRTLCHLPHLEQLKITVSNNFRSVVNKINYCWIKSIKVLSMVLDKFQFKVEDYIFLKFLRSLRSLERLEFFPEAPINSFDYCNLDRWCKNGMCWLLKELFKFQNNPSFKIKHLTLGYNLFPENIQLLTTFDGLESLTLCPYFRYPREDYSILFKFFPLYVYEPNFGNCFQKYGEFYWGDIITHMVVGNGNLMAFGYRNMISLWSFRDYVKNRIGRSVVSQMKHSSTVTSISFLSSSLLISSTPNQIYLWLLTDSPPTLLQTLPAPNLIKACTTFYSSNSFLFAFFETHFTIFQLTGEDQLKEIVTQSFPHSLRKLVSVSNVLKGEFVVKGCRENLHYQLKKNGSVPSINEKYLHHGGEGDIFIGDEFIVTLDVHHCEIFVKKEMWPDISSKLSSINLSWLPCTIVNDWLYCTSHHLLILATDIGIAVVSQCDDVQENKCGWMQQYDHNCYLLECLSLVEENGYLFSGWKDGTVKIWKLIKNIPKNQVFWLGDFGGKFFSNPVQRYQ